MPLSKPKMRNQIHSREIKCFGYKRGDGFWDIEGSMIDTKSYSFDNNDRGGVSSGEPIHYMQIRITLDDNLVGAGKGKLKSAFSKMQKGKISSRQLLNKFVKLVA